MFLQRFPLSGTAGLLYHTEAVICPRPSFDPPDRTYLDGLIPGIETFEEIDDSWWTARGDVLDCVELGYGGAACADTCCGVPFGTDQTAYPLNARRAVISNADVSEKRVYLYGTGDFGGVEARGRMCNPGRKCWSGWSGMDYNPLTNNCNTFTSAVLKCVYGLSEAKPNLG